MNNVKKIIFVILISFIVSGCAATFPRKIEPPRATNLTLGTIKTKIVKGQTTQAEILQLLGSPNIATKNRSNNEVWNYNRMSFEGAAGADDWGGSRAMSITTTKSFDLIIEFDEKDIVKDYSVIQSSF